MNYQQTLTYLYNQLPVFQHQGGIAYKEGLENSQTLDQYFGYPHRQYKTIHVGGTNGKGSTSHLLSAILQKSAYKVGLFTSPHLVDFRERIRIDGKMIDEAYVIEFVSKHSSFFEPIGASFFELTMMMAFQYFADQNVDVAIIEVGLGGRLDSTNIISPDLSIITNISLDHVQFLGDTPAKIAVEKAGIIKPNTPIVIGEASGEIKSIFENKAKLENASIVFADQQGLILSANVDQKSWCFHTHDYPDLVCELGGLAQLKNGATVLCSILKLKELGYTIPQKAVYEGFAHVCSITGLMGRWQTLQICPTVICDTGHNIGGFEYIVEQLKNIKYKRLHIVIGMVNDKDILSILRLLPQDAIYYFTRANIARAMGEKELAQKASEQGLQGDSYKSVDSAIERALQKADDGDLIFVGGSNFVVGEALAYYRKV